MAKRSVRLVWLPLCLLALLLVVQLGLDHFSLRPLWQRYWQELHLQQTQQQLSEHQTHLAQMLSAEPQQVDVALTQLAQQQAVEQLWLINRSGLVLFGSDRNDIGNHISLLPIDVAQHVDHWRNDKESGLHQLGNNSFWLGQLESDQGAPILLLAQIAPSPLMTPLAQSLYDQMQQLWFVLTTVLTLLITVLFFFTIARPIRRQVRIIDDFRLYRRTSPLLNVGWHEFKLIDGKLQQLFIELTDSERRALRHAEQLKTMYDNITDGVLLVESRGTIEFANDRAAQILGFTDVAALQRHKLHELLPQEQRLTECQSFDWVYCHPDGSKRQLHVQVELRVDLDGCRQQLFLQDRSAQVHAEQQLRKQAFYDHSGILNQAGLEQYWHQLSLAGANAELWVMVAIGIDRLRDINISFGLEISDRLTHYVAANLKRLAPRGGFCGRIARERYLIAYPLQQEQEDPRNVCHQLTRHSMMRSMAIGGKAVRFSVSCGYVRLVHTHKFSAGLQRCLTALDVAQERGLGMVHNINDEEFRQHSLQNRTLLRLHNAIGQQQLLLYIHPKLRLRDRSIIGGEALVRWRDKDGWISPADFIPMAERADIIHYIDQYMINAVCRLIVALRQRNVALKIAVNVSAKHFGREEFRRYMRQVARRYQLRPHELEVEITEYSLLQSDSGIFESITLLEQLGISLAIDDFGTGASNLQSLIDLPIKHLKIDKSFTEQLVGEGRGKPVVESIFGFAKQLGIEITAEGIETEQQCQVLNQLDCEYAQGFLFFKPMPEQEFIDLVAGKTAPSVTNGSTALSPQKAKAKAKVYFKDGVGRGQPAVVTANNTGQGRSQPQPNGAARTAPTNNKQTPTD
ncbi:EAL domain-containing protein [uncultured Ferrimonas sp.]|uniref:EAL domain-containing protein n=1 Tax=uncultured Ferrimonas sp. TaxID=432640 RepID=UPI00263389E6|nr:EAL domain-containing protein [uncultured Ferrimonas sp.]